MCKISTVLKLGPNQLVGPVQPRTGPRISLVKTMKAACSTSKYQK